MANFDLKDRSAIVGVGNSPYGRRLLTNLVGVSNDAIRARMPVEIVFEDVTAEVTLARFKPRDG